jgi:hypothetical protein
VPSNVHQVTGEAVAKLPGFRRVQPYALAAGGALMFAGATWEAKGAFVYGAGADYAFTKHLSIND